MTLNAAILADPALARFPCRITSGAEDAAGERDRMAEREARAV